MIRFPWRYCRLLDWCSDKHLFRQIVYELYSALKSGVAGKIKYTHRTSLGSSRHK